MAEFVVGVGVGTLVAYAFYRRLGSIDRKVDALMAPLSDFTDQIANIQASVDAGNADIATIKQQIEDLKGQLADGGLTAEEEAEVKAQLDSLQAAVEAQAATLDASADETNPD